MPPETATEWPIDWPAPPGVRAFMSTRRGGVSAGPYASLNLGLHVGDDAVHVAENRRRLAQRLGCEPLWLNQVHGSAVVPAMAVLSAEAGPADAQWAIAPGLACAVLVADCLPVLFSTRDGRAVAAAHAGWRGLAAGVLENCLSDLCRAAHCDAADLQAWLGPCIGAQHFEVGDEVRQAFGLEGRPHFAAHRRADGSSAWLCHLADLARARLHAAGLPAVFGGNACTFKQASDFFSFRRDGITGRMAAVIVIQP